jgi:hypothetical protein
MTHELKGFRRRNPVVWLAMTFSVLIELSQLYDVPWIDSIRHTPLGGLVLGFGFFWSDFTCYALGDGR